MRKRNSSSDNGYLFLSSVLYHFLTNHCAKERGLKNELPAQGNSNATLRIQPRHLESHSLEARRRAKEMRKKEKGSNATLRVPKQTPSQTTMSKTFRGQTQPRIFLIKNPPRSDGTIRTQTNCPCKVPNNISPSNVSTVCLQTNSKPLQHRGAWHSHANGSVHNHYTVHHKIHLSMPKPCGHRVGQKTATYIPACRKWEMFLWYRRRLCDDEHKAGSCMVFLSALKYWII